MRNEMKRVVYLDDMDELWAAIYGNDYSFLDAVSNADIIICNGEVIKGVDTHRT